MHKNIEVCMDIIDRLREIATSQGLTFANIEQAVSLGNGTIGKWRKQSPSVNNLSLVANYLNVSMDYLVSGVSNTDAAPLAPTEKELLSAFRHLTEKDKWKFIGKIQQCAEQFNDNCETAEEIALKERKAG
jgi:transcriptional regulator with XRE-family HTH domain